MCEPNTLIDVDVDVDVDVDGDVDVNGDVDVGGDLELALCILAYSKLELTGLSHSTSRCMAGNGRGTWLVMVRWCAEWQSQWHVMLD